MRYLTDYDMRAALKRGKLVEQFLGGSSGTDYSIIRRLSLAPFAERFQLIFYETFDDGSDTFHDVYEFSSLDPDVAPPEHTFDTLEDALTHAESVYGASLSRWMNQFVVQDEYAEYRRTKSA